jgi:hypothetical protein
MANVSFATFGEGDAKELYRLSHLYWKEAKFCEKAGAYLAGCVMLGAALETMLRLMIYVHHEEAAAAGGFPRYKDAASGALLPKALLDWSLEEMLNVASKAGWLPREPKVKGDWNKRGAKIGDWSRFAQKVRNLVHSNVYLRDHNRRRITSEILRTQFEVVELCGNWLAHHNNEKLYEDLKRKGWLPKEEKCKATKRRCR